MKLNIKDIINTLKDVRDYVIPIKKIKSKFQNINSLEEIENFIHERLPKNPIKLNIPNLYHGFTDLEEKEKTLLGPSQFR